VQYDTTEGATYPPDWLQYWIQSTYFEDSEYGEGNDNFGDWLAIIESVQLIEA